MAHQRGFNYNEFGHMFTHYAREAKHYSNTNIDPERSHLNYNLAAETQPKKQVDFLNEQLSQPDLFCLNRPNVNRIMTWVFQVPKDLPEAEWEDFFKYCREFTLKRYFGDDWKRFEISAWVHMDEFLMKDGKLTEEHGAPHLHECIIPAVWDKKKNRWKVCHKERVPDSDLNTFHDDLAKYLEERMGHEVHVHEHNTPSNGNLTVLQEKFKTAQKELEEATRAKEEALRQKAVTEQENTDLKAENEVLKTEIEGKNTEIEEKNVELGRYETMLKQVRRQHKIRKGEAIPDYEEGGIRTKYAKYSLEDNKKLRDMASHWQADRDAEKVLIGSEILDTLNQALDANENLYNALEEKDRENKGKDKIIFEQSEKIDRLNLENSEIKSNAQDLINALGKFKDLLPEWVQNLARKVQELVFPPRQQERTRNITKDRGISR